MKDRIDKINEVLFNNINTVLPSIATDSLISKLITAIIATVLAVIVFIFIRGITKFIEKKVLSLQSRKLQSIKIQNQQIFTGNQIAWGIGVLFKWFRYFCYLIILYLYINIYYLISNIY